MNREGFFRSGAVKVAHLTYTFMLLQTGGHKGRMLHEAMSRWTQVHTRFLDHCAGKVREFEEACTVTSDTGRTRRITRFLEKWVRREIAEVEGFDLLESSVKDSLITHLGGQLMSFLELRGMQESQGFPSGRGHGDLDFERYLEEFIRRDWTEGPDLDKEELDLEYATVQGKVQGYRSKALYSPMEICRYDATGKNRNYRLLRSANNTLFALIYLLPPDGTASKATRGDLREVVSGEVQKSISNKAALFPLATSKWVMRKLDRWQPKASRLVYRDGVFYLHVAFETDPAEPREWQTILGVDMGKNRFASVAVVSLDGREVLDRYSVPGLHRNRINDITGKVARAQAKGGHYSYSYKKLNEEMAHVIANGIIDKAKRYRSKIVVEDLENMRRLMMATSSASNFNKGRKHNIYGNLLKVLEYKCVLAGIELEKVDPWWTSQTCPACGTIDPHNRLTVVESGGKRRVSRERFRCVGCDYKNEDADAVAAVNIARKSLFKEVWVKEKKNNKTKKDVWQEFASSICHG